MPVAKRKTKLPRYITKRWPLNKREKAARDRAFPAPPPWSSYDYETLPGEFRAFRNEVNDALRSLGEQLEKVAASNARIETSIQYGRDESRSLRNAHDQVAERVIAHENRHDVADARITVLEGTPRNGVHKPGG